MPSKYASGKRSIAECDRCGFRYMLKELKTLTIKTKNVKIKVCPTCFEPDQPQLSLGLYPINDPQAVREPRPDVSYIQSGYTGIQTKFQTGPAEDETGYPGGGSRIIQWGWYPVGGSRANDAGLTPNNLAVPGVVNSVTVLTT
jgi:hypothetical protein